MLNNTKKDQKGFTIIEVLIVLAIAGLILLIVFLAVPALQRNSRNTQMKNSAAAVLGGISEYVNNNNGQLPAAGSIDVDTDTGEVTIGATGTAQATAKVQPGYEVNDAGTMPTGDDTGVISIALNRKCDGINFATATTNRSFSAGYLVEGGQDPSPQCQES